MNSIENLIKSTKQTVKNVATLNSMESSDIKLIMWFAETDAVFSQFSYERSGKKIGIFVSDALEIITKRLQECRPLYMPDTEQNYQWELARTEKYPRILEILEECQKNDIDLITL